LKSKINIESTDLNPVKSEIRIPSGCCNSTKEISSCNKRNQTESVPIIPESDFPRLLPKKTLIKNPKKGARTKTKAIWYSFPFILLSFLNYRCNRS
jgi:hypothetical protein